MVRARLRVAGRNWTPRVVWAVDDAKLDETGSKTKPWNSFTRPFGGLYRFEPLRPGRQAIDLNESPCSNLMWRLQGFLKSWWRGCRRHCSGVSPPEVFFASSISVTATRI